MLTASPTTRLEAELQEKQGKKCIGHKSGWFFTVNMMLFVYLFQAVGRWLIDFASVYLTSILMQSDLNVLCSLQCFHLICSIHEQVLTFPYLKHWEEYFFAKIALNGALQREFSLLDLHSVISIKTKSHQGWNLSRYFFPLLIWGIENPEIPPKIWFVALKK